MQKISKSEAQSILKKEGTTLIELAGKWPPNTDAFRQGAIAALKWGLGLTQRKPSEIIAQTGPIEKIEREREWKE